MIRQFDNLLMHYENRLRLFITKLGKRNMLLGFAAIGIVGIAVISYTSQLESNLNDPNYLFKRGSEYFFEEKYDKAIADYTAALKIKPNNPDYLYGRGGTYLQNREYYKAVADFTTALLIKPDNPKYLLQRGTAYLLQQNYDSYNRAVADFEALLRVEPYNTDARQLLELAREKIAAFK